MANGQHCTSPITAGVTTVTVTASPSQTVWDLGPTAITCYGPGRPWVQGMTEAASTTCAYTYKETWTERHKGSSRSRRPFAAT